MHRSSTQPFGRCSETLELRGPAGAETQSPVQQLQPPPSLSPLAFLGLDYFKRQMNCIGKVARAADWRTTKSSGSKVAGGW